MSSSGYPSNWRRQSLPAHRNRDPPVSPPSSKPFVSYLIPEHSASLESSLPPDRRLNEGLSDDCSKALEVPTLGDLDDEDPEIEDCQLIGSYNWTKRPNPTIIVPGSPPEWTNRPLPFNVQPDMGIQQIDQNSYRMPSANLLPLVVAVNQKYKDEGVSFPWGTMDFVTDRNGLRKLLRWTLGGQVKDFRIDTQLAGSKTVLLNRWERRTREQFSGRTYGLNFEKASTTPATGCNETSGHHRIVRYDFNGLKMVVRFEVDACMPPPRKPRPSKSEPSVDSLIDSIGNMSLTTTAAPFSSSTMPALNIINGGSYVPQASIIELVTCSEYRKESYNWKEAYGQLFLSQTAHHIMAIHYRGRFTSLEKRKLSSQDLQKVHDEMKPDLKKLRKVLEIIQRTVIEHGSNGRLSFVCSDGKLSVYQRKSQTACLPDEAMSCFELNRV
ncbi:hypothetical protein P691DRAFT_802815 [Macrolepiota fuliginosa MF-IS2]|uniref:Geranylgeranyl pyrophosphate synthetase n=1 Tax=Macrolepiota fuliginosa MF-IS2 TaxID=1400762 RepID=A0A9P5XNU2_9AGAR|nr:hypothetical protein P691DRAFT_802815 [Macrolepiota fuliginosa MF-IS2]